MTDIDHELKHQLDEKAETLSPEIKDKLAQARANALLQARLKNEAKPSANDSQWIKPMMALAACVCLVVPLWLSGVLTVNPQFDLANQLQPSNLYQVDTDIELEQSSILLELATLNDDELELVENLDFALWLLQQDQAPS